MLGQNACRFFEEPRHLVSEERFCAYPQKAEKAGIPCQQENYTRILCFKTWIRNSIHIHIRETSEHHRIWSRYTYLAPFWGISLITYTKTRKYLGITYSNSIQIDIHHKFKMYFRTHGIGIGGREYLGKPKDLSAEGQHHVEHLEELVVPEDKNFKTLGNPGILVQKVKKMSKTLHPKMETLVRKILCKQIALCIPSHPQNWVGLFHEITYLNSGKCVCHR